MIPNNYYPQSHPQQQEVSYEEDHVPMIKPIRIVQFVSSQITIVKSLFNDLIRFSYDLVIIGFPHWLNHLHMH